MDSNEKHEDRTLADLKSLDEFPSELPQFAKPNGYLAIGWEDKTTHPETDGKSAIALKVNAKTVKLAVDGLSGEWTMGPRVHRRRRGGKGMSWHPYLPEPRPALVDPGEPGAGPTGRASGRA